LFSFIAFATFFIYNGNPLGMAEWTERRDAVMDTYAYIFVEVAQGKSRDVSQSISQIEGVQSAHIVTGPYDIIVFARAADIQGLWELIIARIQNIPGVVRTITNIVAE
jgi:DNA-binding Lrp family transcriptional regulator